MESTPIEKTPLWEEVKPILKDKKPIKYEYRAMVHTEKEDMPVFKIISIDTIRDYHNSIGDRKVIIFKMPLGDYTKRLYPYRANLELSLKKILLDETAGHPAAKPDVVIERYKAIFMSQCNPQVGATDLTQHDTASMNLVDIVDVHLELLDLSLEVLRIKTIQGVFRNISPKDLIHSTLGGESQKVKIGGKPAVDGIDIAEPDNKSSIKHVVIPSGTRLTSLPVHMQEEMTGVYQTGIGNYMQLYNKKKVWFVYPLYDIKRFDTSQSKAIFYAIPPEKLPSIDRTYKQENGLIKILVTANRKYTDSAEADYMNYGVGIRQTNASSMMKKPVEMTEKGPNANRARLNRETASRKRDDGLNYAAVTPTSSNPYVEFAKVNARALARIDLTWENANHDLLSPGMPCKYVHMEHGELTELKGSIHFVHSFVSLEGTTMDSIIYKNHCQITILVEKLSKKPKPPTVPPIGDF